jgi:hypothetical protein
MSSKGAAAGSRRPLRISVFPVPYVRRRSACGVTVNALRRQRRHNAQVGGCTERSYPRVYGFAASRRVYREAEAIILSSRVG